jgi:hypothetical protein
MRTMDADQEIPKIAESVGERWFTRAPESHLWLTAILLSAVVYLLLSILDWLSFVNFITLPIMMMVDGAVAVLCGALVLKIALDARARRRALFRRLEMIGEMNHHIRNALEEIALSAHLSHDPQVITTISNASERIQWALREILPQRLPPPQP